MEKKTSLNNRHHMLNAVLTISFCVEYFIFWWENIKNNI